MEVKQYKILRIKESKRSHVPDYIFSIIASIIIYFLVNNFNGIFKFKFFTDEFAQILPFLNFALMTNIFMNLVLIVFDNRKARMLAQIIIDLMGMYVLYFIYNVFPFNFAIFPGVLTFIPLVKLSVLFCFIVIGIFVAIEIFRLAFSVFSIDE